SCCSIRWFVPLLAPLYYVLAVALRERPGWRLDFGLLAAAGLALGATTAWTGPWDPFPPFFLPLQAAAVALWLGASRLPPDLPARLAGWLGRLPWAAIGLAALAV